MAAGDCSRMPVAAGWGWGWQQGEDGSRMEGGGGSRMGVVTGRRWQQNGGR